MISPRQPHRRGDKQYISKTPTVRGERERYMAHPVIPVGQSNPSNPKSEGLTQHIKGHGQSQRKPPTQKGDNQTSKVARKQQRVTLVSQPKWLERKERSCGHACIKVGRGETLHIERHP